MTGRADSILFSTDPGETPLETIYVGTHPRNAIRNPFMGRNDPWSYLVKVHVRLQPLASDGATVSRLTHHFRSHEIPPHVAATIRDLRERHGFPEPMGTPETSAEVFDRLRGAGVLDPPEGDEDGELEPLTQGMSTRLAEEAAEAATALLPSTDAALHRGHSLPPLRGTMHALHHVVAGEGVPATGAPVGVLSASILKGMPASGAPKGEGVPATGVPLAAEALPTGVRVADITPAPIVGHVPIVGEGKT